MSRTYDVAVVGAGIIGLAHAYQLAKRGMRVVVSSVGLCAEGASVRNFGMIWPIGQPSGELYRLARRSREIWLEVLRAAELWHEECGSLHLAYHEDEGEVLQEFVSECRAENRPAELLRPDDIAASFPVVRQGGLRYGVFSPTEATVDPRQVIGELSGWLNRTFGVDFHFSTSVLARTGTKVVTTSGEWQASRLVICTGEDFRELAPDAFASAGLLRCKLQMLRSEPLDDFRLGPMLAAGLTLRHYRCFANCPSLLALKSRLDTEMPDYGRLGIHVMAAQNGLGELILGDSHEYGDDIAPFDRSEIEELILNYLHTFVDIPDLRIVARWNGVYVKHPTDAYVVAPLPDDTMAVTAVGGAGMTLSFGLAEQVVTSWLGEKT